MVIMLILRWHPSRLRQLRGRKARRPGYSKRTREREGRREGRGTAKEEGSPPSSAFPKASNPGSFCFGPNLGRDPSPDRSIHKPNKWRSTGEARRGEARPLHPGKGRRRRRKPSPASMNIRLDFGQPLGFRLRESLDAQ